MATAVEPIVDAMPNEPEANKLFRMVMKYKGSDLHLKVGDQLLLGREGVVDGLLRDLCRARHVGDGDVLVAALGEQAGSGSRDVPSGPLLLDLAQSAVGHPPILPPS